VSESRLRRQSYVFISVLLFLSAAAAVGLALRSPAPRPTPGVAAVPAGAPSRSASAAAPAYSPQVKARLLKSLPKPMFRDVAQELGIDFVHATDPELRRARAELKIPLDIAGGGVSAADYNADGYPDLFFAGFGGGRLFRNNGGKRFEDVTGPAGLKLEGESRAGYFVDHDNDGDLDLFLTFVGQGVRLFENLGNGAFAERTQEAGFRPYQDITHELVFFDMDNDGLIDIYAASFGRWDQGQEPIVGRQNFNGAPNRLFHHVVESGQHRYQEIGEAAGVADRGWTHSVGAWDYDQDGWVDLFSFNDFGRAHVYHNLGNRTFKESSLELAIQEDYNAMGFALMDLARDGAFEMYVSEISNPTYDDDGKRVRHRHGPGEGVLEDRVLQKLERAVNNRLFRYTKDGLMENVHGKYFEPAEMGWAWDCSPIDYENDGDLDFLVLNGTEDHPPRLEGESRPHYLGQAEYLRFYANDVNVFFLNEGGFLYNISGACELSYPGNSRASAALDFDLDGDLDLAVNDYESRAKLFRNEEPWSNSWVRFRLRGTRSSRDGFGARIRVEDDLGNAQSATKVSGAGFLSQDPMELHFGLGKATRVKRALVHWPSGIEQAVEDLEARRVHTIVEPAK